jgi:integral membrane protein (TIGR01906 family)
VSAAAGRRVASILVGVATAVVIVAVAVVLFFNPIWVAFEQDRTGVPQLLGYTPEQVRTATNAILGEFAFGPGTFAVEVNGQPVLNERERGHMADVRRVATWFAILTIVAAVGLAVAYRRAPKPRAWFWQAVGAGGLVLAAAVLSAGVFVLLFFDQTFELFHRLLFPAGSYSFDPLNERLVQLFPMTFWSETAIALSVVLIVISLVVAGVALRRVPLADARAGGTASATGSSPPAAAASPPTSRSS